MIDELLATARTLATAGAARPRQADLKRAISTAYYAVFHALARDAADPLVGAGARARPEWARVHRALDHGAAKNACQAVKAGPLAPVFVDLQEARHKADYDPTFRVNRADAIGWCAQADGAVVALRAVPKAERRAFAVELLFKKRP